MRFFRNFFISQQIKLKLDTDSKLDADSYFLAQKAVLGTISDNMTQNHFFTPLFGQTPLRNNVVIAIPKVPSDQKLFGRMCYTLILKVTKFQLSTRT